MKRQQLLILILLSLLFSCNNVTKAPSEKKTTRATTTQDARLRTPNIDSSKIEKPDISAGINYVFSNDSLCQMLYLKEIIKSKKDGLPEKLKFKLVLHDKFHKQGDKIFEGVAKLFSSEESFSDNLEKDPEPYDASDYNFATSDYRIVIRLDNDKYEAAVATITAKQIEMVLGSFSSYLKRYPNYDVMKKGECN